MFMISTSSTIIFLTSIIGPSVSSDSDSNPGSGPASELLSSIYLFSSNSLLD
jgi:hypothetical protein